MPQNIPEDFGHVKLIWTLDGDTEEMVSTFGITIDSGVDGLTAAQTIFNNWVAAFAPAELSDEWSFVGVELVRRNGGVLFTHEYREISPGSSVVGHLPQNNALLLKKVTAAGGREGRGRMYVPAGYLSEGAVGPTGIIASANVTTLQGSATQFLGTLVTDGFQMHLLHSDVTNTPDPVTALTVDNVIASQRRRLRGR